MSKITNKRTPKIKVINGKKYAYDMSSYWDKEKKKYGKKSEYLGKVISENPLVCQPKGEKAVTVTNTADTEIKTEFDSEITQEKISDVADYGNVFLLDHVAKNTGLLSVLQKCFPNKWREILACAEYIVSENGAMYLCEQWAESSAVGAGLNLSSQRLSELINSLGESEQMEFYREWSSLRLEKEYLALDITSISSYSELIEFVEYGYNRDGEDLPQINLAMIYGEKSRLPVYCRAYPGSIKDVSTLKNIATITKELNLQKMHYVMDKGFYSNANVDQLLEERIKFAVGVPFTTNLAKESVAECSADIVSPNNAFLLNNNLVYAQTLMKSMNNRRAYVHVFFDKQRCSDEQTKFMNKILNCESDFINGKIDAENKLFKKFFSVRKTKKGVNIHRNETAINDRMKHFGYFVVLTNDSKNPQYILDVYRTKDCVEKSFENIKNDLDLKRLRVHSDKSMRGRIFLGFIALILASQIRNTMKDNNLYKSFTFSSLIKELKKLKIVNLSNCKSIFTEMTAPQKLIFSAFGVKLEEVLCGG